MDNNSNFNLTPLTPQRLSASTFDPSQFQHLYDQMQNNQDFLQQMQGFLAMQSYQVTTEADEISSQRTSNNPLTLQDDDLYYKKPSQDNIQSFQSSSIDNVNYELIHQQPEGNQVYFDPNINALMQQELSQLSIQETLDSQLSQNNNPINQDFAFDPSIITPEYLQMFTQFYQMFSSLQSSMQPDIQQNLNDPQFLQNLMFTYFTQQMQTQNQQEQPHSPIKVTRDYNTNLPLAAIPESKESILEENSQWQTVKTTKLGLLMSANSAMAKEGQENHCSCCIARLDSKRKSQQCSNFNLGCNSVRASQNQDPFKNEYASNHTSQYNPIKSAQVTPQNIGIPQGINFGFQNDTIYPNTFSQGIDTQGIQQQILQHYQVQLENGHSQGENQVQINALLSPKNHQRNTSNEVLSPLQIQQNKIIEYMLDNNDFSNYKQRREVIKGERMSRTLSRSISKQSNYQPKHRNHFSIYSQNQANATSGILPHYQANDDNCFSELKPVKYDVHGYQFNQVHRLYLDENNPLTFFSPQVTAKQGHFKLHNYEDIISHQDQVASPQDQDKPKSKQGQNLKRTQEKIREIRRLNELQRGKENLKKPQTRKNLHKDQQKQVFEIRDLKKSKSRKNTHMRKQSYNGANKENVKLLQSNIHQNYEMSHQNIMLSPNQDLIMSMEESGANYHSKKDSDTFKSLKSVNNQKYASNNYRSNVDLAEHKSPRIENLVIQNGQLNFEIDQDSLKHLRIRQQSTDLNTLILQEQLSGKKPGQEIHLIKKPVQTEEFKKIQERLNKYYQTKKREEDELKRRLSHADEHQQQYQNKNHNDTETMSMTKTYSSFKSLMMKTMSQMSIQQDNNIQQQFMNGKTQRAQLCGMLTNLKTGNQSMNVSSIQDDFSCAGDYSDNLTKIISPKNLYNGSLANIKHRNIQQEKHSEYDNQYEMVQKKNINKPVQNSCLPNSLFFKVQGKNGEETLSLKYNSRQPSLCYCGKIQCSCDQQSKKDLLCHFQNFLCEMDKHQSSHQGFNKESIYGSPIPNSGNISNNDFLLSNFHLIGIGRPSSLTSRMSRGGPSKRQSSIGGSQYPKMKRFSSGANLNAKQPLKIFGNNLQHCQSTQAFDNKPKLDLHEQDDLVLKNLLDQDLQSNTTQTRTQTSSGLEKLDTNKQEEIRLLTLERDIMHKAFIEKTHKLNLKDDQRAELLQRIQKHKLGQQSVQNNSLGGSSSGDYIHNNGYNTNPNTSQATATTDGLKHSQMIAKYDSGTSLEARRKVVKLQKKVNSISKNQSEREQAIQDQEYQLQNL